jgi:hypothetical protein
MITLTALQADITGNLASSGYLLGGISVVVAAFVVYLCIRLFRARKNH